MERLIENSLFFTLDYGADLSWLKPAAARARY